MYLNTKQIELLEDDLDNSKVSERKGPKNMTLHYLKSYDVINTANRIFGYDGWSYTVDKLSSSVYEQNDKIVTTASALVTVSILSKDASAPSSYLSRQDVGHGNANTNFGVPDFENAEKEAVSDALKRALRSFGNQFGNVLYDKEYLSENFSGSSKPKFKKANTSGSKLEGGATEKQKGYVVKLLESHNKKLDEVSKMSMDDMTKAEASRLIELLQS